MPIHLRYATEADSAALAHINAASFSPSIFYQNAFHDVTYSALYTLKYARSLQRLIDPRTHNVVAIDTDTGTVVGSARWIIPQDRTEPMAEISEDGQRMAENPEQFIPVEVKQEIYASWVNMTKESRKKHLRDDDLLLEYLAIAPDHQGKGIGSQLLKWGLAQADTLNARIYLEASVDGYLLYSKNGFEVREEFNLDFSLLGGNNTGRYIAMIRKPTP
ncbi:acyl-CoA N-acyltransferase [Aspergillus avenaceus]|uniref:Acyl-CoA N-acyltransferase n=1 Tax=Aspergillus avenaceus TaxID=36643 RepID=A0A5N6TFU9_ASPAV|nr:acyl-CoA N-acyltransferase [Aspergillus avenaceus]